MITLLIALAATSCQKKAEGQTVAIVNNEEITAAELNAELTNNAAANSGDTKQARAAALQRLVDRKLLVQQAQTDGLDKSPEFINQQRRSTEDLLINMLVSKRLNTAKLPNPEEITRFEASKPEAFAGREIWTLSQLIYPLPKNAALTAKIAAAKSLDQIADALTAAGLQFTRETKKIDTAVFPHNIYIQIANLAPGEPFVAPGPDKAVANVITAREPAPLGGDQARTVALNAMRRNQAQTMVEDRLKSLRASAKIEYQPGFGPPSK
jgi:peptidyl-prolyl cis-trans isomerase C